MPHHPCLAPQLAEEIHHLHVKINQLCNQVLDMALDLTKLNAAEQTVATTINNLRAQIAALRAQIDTGNPADQTAVDAVADKITADTATQ